MVWRGPRNHTDYCYFCLTNITGFNASFREKIKYPNLRSAMRPVPHSDDIPVPTLPVNKNLSSSDEEMASRKDFAESISLKDIESTYSGTSGNEQHWMILLVICICQNSSQSSWLLGLNGGTWKTSCATAQTYLACLRPLVCHIILQTGVFSYTLPSEVSRVFFCTTGINIPAFPLHTLPI